MRIADVEKTGTKCKFSKNRTIRVTEKKSKQASKQTLKCAKISSFFLTEINREIEHKLTHYVRTRKLQF